MSRLVYRPRVESVMVVSATDVRRGAASISTLFAQASVYERHTIAPKTVKSTNQNASLRLSSLTPRPMAGPWVSVQDSTHFSADVVSKSPGMLDCDS